jgi:hypothetical protein
LVPGLEGIPSRHGKARKVSIGNSLGVAVLLLELPGPGNSLPGDIVLASIQKLSL